MPKIFTFSTADKRPEELDAVEAVKAICEKRKIVFSRLVCELLAKWLAEEKANGRA